MNDFIAGGLPNMANPAGSFRAAAAFASRSSGSLTAASAALSCLSNRALSNAVADSSFSSFWYRSPTPGAASTRSVSRWVPAYGWTRLRFICWLFDPRIGKLANARSRSHGTKCSRLVFGCRYRQ